MKYALTIALMLSLSFGLITESFRYQSTAFLWEDDYDLLFDPARIPEIEGARLWTGLSNFVTGNEELFDNSGVPFFFIGGVTNVGKYYPGFVYDRSALKTALPTNLYGPGEDYLYGDAEVTTTDWRLDSDGDTVGASILRQTQSAYDAFSNSDFYFGIGTQMDGLRWGLGYMRINNKQTMTNPYENFTYTDSVIDWEEDTLEFLDQETSEGDHIFKDAENAFILSAWLDRENISFGLTGEFAMLGHDHEAVIMSDQATYDHPEDKTSDFTEAAALDSSIEPQSGTRIAAELKAFYDYNENAQGRYYASFSTESMDYGDDALSYYYMTSEESYNDFTYDTSTSYTFYDGSISNTCFRVGTKQLFHINDRFRFGIGLFLGMTSYSDSSTAQDSIFDIVVYDDGDTVTNDPDDYRAEAWSGQTWMALIDGNTMEIMVPVGAEFNISDPLVFRLGAQHTIAYDEWTETHELLDYQPAEVRIEFGDGSVFETIDTDYTEDFWETTEDETRTSTNYFYGIGWHVNDNLQIDLMHFDELTDLSNWRLSATLRFD